MNLKGSGDPNGAQLLDESRNSNNPFVIEKNFNPLEVPRKTTVKLFMGRSRATSNFLLSLRNSTTR